MRVLRFLSALLMGALLLTAAALPMGAAPVQPEARELEAELTLSGTPLIDNKKYTDLRITAGGTLTVETQTQIAGLYLIFDRVPKPWTCRGEYGEMACGQNGFLHEYVDVAEGLGAARSLTLTFPDGATVKQISIWSAGTLPDYVQVWEPPYTEADLLLFSTHSDDEHLFFAGILPTCIDRGLSAQVVYMVNHNDIPARTHEQLDGLWTVGVRNYPVIGPFPDLYSTALETARTIFAGRGYTEDHFIAYAVEQLRRFRPQVVIGHDVNGEYNHGAHMVNTAALQKALEAAPDAAAYPDSAQRWGTWDVPKTYLHLWQEGQVTMNWDVPLASYDGLTAFQVSNLGYNVHTSQHWTWFTRWIRGTKDAPITAASQIKTYSPCLYGLYRTTVGADTPGVNDFFEHITPYAEQRAAETTSPPETTVSPETTSAVTERPPVLPEETVPATTAAPSAGIAGSIFSLLLPALLVLIAITAVAALLGPFRRR